MGISKNRETPQNGWFIMEDHIKMDDLRVPLFPETLIYTLLIYIFPEDVCKTKGHNAVVWLQLNVGI